MSNESREHLSCFMDGEISKETSRFLVRRLGADNELRDTWARYHLVRDCLRYQEGGLPGTDLCGRVKQALANETLPSPQGKRGWSTPAWLKPVAGVAVAASVALMAIITVGPGQSPMNTPAGELTGNPPAESFVSPKNVLTPSPRSQPVRLLGGNGISDQRMNSYLLRHYQVTGSTGGRGFVTFVPIVVTQVGAQADAQADPERGEEEGENSLDESSLNRNSRDRVNESVRQ